ncbi:MAG: succinate dehydrogenase cytochrome b subunit [Bacteroidota bacterium]
MSKLASFYQSSVGKKFVVGFTGLFLCTFLVVHLYINLYLFKHDGGETFNVYAEFMATNPVVRTLEIVLFLGFILHILTSTILWYKNRSARPQKYLVTHPLESSTASSRITFLTGSIIFMFLVVHMDSFWISSRFFAAENPSMFNLVRQKFSSPLYDGFYLAALFLLGFHLRHGFQSAFQTFGIRGKRYEGMIELVGVVFWLLIPIGFAAMPIYFLMNL